MIGVVPRAASASASARPMPREAPVISAILPSKPSRDDGSRGAGRLWVAHRRSSSRAIVIFWTSAVPSSNRWARASRYTRSISVGEK